MSLKNLNKTSLITSFIGLALLGYVIIKAYSSSFTHDESYSYLYFTQNSFMDVLAYKNWFSNNHILNTIFIKYFDILFGSSELALRMPNIFLFVLFMLYTWINSILLLLGFELNATLNKLNKKSKVNISDEKS